MKGSVLQVIAVLLVVHGVVSHVGAQSRQPLKDKENPLLIGKRQINKHQINFHSLEKEMALGRRFANEIDQRMKMVEDPAITEYVNRIGQNLVLHSDAKVPFTIKVVDTDEVNAFALPGGYFYVNKGLLLTAENESELAGVMAHEIAHVAARHAMEQYSKSQLIQWATVPLIFVGGLPGYAVWNAAGVGIPLTFLKFSRNAEAEADMLGAQYAWASGYDPNGMVTFFEKLRSNGHDMSSVFSTHPATSDRIGRVQQLIGRFPERDEYLISSSDFAQIRRRLAVVGGQQRMLDAMGDAPNRPTLRRRGSPTDASDPHPEAETEKNRNKSTQPPRMRRQHPQQRP